MVFSAGIFHTRFTLTQRLSSTIGMMLPVVTLKSVVILGFCRSSAQRAAGQMSAVNVFEKCDTTDIYSTI